MMINSYADVHKYYLLKSNSFLNKAHRILKTDCYDEAFGRPIIGEPYLVYLLEYEIKHIEIARKKNPNLTIIEGDIRDIPFKDNWFDLILDLSTIDHVPPQDVPKVLSEYRRICSGTIYIVVWFGSDIPHDKWQPTDQYFFNQEWFMNQLKDFKVMNTRRIYHDFTINKDLWEMELR